jgi:HD-GYP domain-containing protein (c-di-GMP phosphodiesterase class II)
MRKNTLYFAAAIGSTLGITAIIELTGGLPSQLAHLYYLPVVVAALMLPTKLRLAVAALAAVAVSPLPDLLHGPLGLDPYYDDAAPWNLKSSGWIVRPIAFFAVSTLAAAILKERGAKAEAEASAALFGERLVGERAAKLLATATSTHRGKELNLLSRIDKMILGGSSEADALREIARLTAAFTGSPVAGIAVPDEHGKSLQTFYGHSETSARLSEERLPLGEGVAGWAIMHGTIATSPNVFNDARYAKMAEFARRAGYTSSAAAPIILDAEVLGALVVGHADEHEFTPDELATLQRIADQTAIAVASARQRHSLEGLAHETAIALSDAIESRDPYTGDHCSRLAEYATLTATALGLPAKEIQGIRLGAALHDVGKITVPDSVLKKPDKLTPDEYALIKQHCYSGGQICKRVPFLQVAYPIVYHHHERFDGGGYPDGLKGERIPLGARIVTVVDAYDAMTSDRPYRKALPLAEAESILRDGTGTQWDPAIVDTFLTAIAASTNREPALSRP